MFNLSSDDSKEDAKDIQFKFDQGLTCPSIPVLINNILRDYPDDGQILKELIQNAEDAQASCIKFLIDENSYGKENLVRSNLEEYQGPALLAYNDADFKKEDWSGILLMCESVKKSDPIKVGRFGLGFKSVFHMTDLPSIVSGSFIGFLDPHEIYFNEEGSKKVKRSAHLFCIDENSSEIASCSDQWRPYKHSIFDTVQYGFETGQSYRGTLFRFPLRTNSDNSQICTTLYDQEKIMKLFESIKNEGFLYLLFLKFIQSIEVYRVEQVDSEAKLYLQLNLASDVLENVRLQREKFIESINLKKDCCVIYEAVVEFGEYDEGSSELVHSTQQRFIVSQLCGNYGHDEINNLAETLKILPIVGLAYPLDGGDDSIESQIFCFLPLPIRVKNATGFSMHINGYFSIDSNRRHLKTGSSDDDNCKWNKLLREILMPLALLELIRYYMSERMYSSDKKFYSMFPNPSTILPIWTEFMKNFYTKLVDLPFIPVKCENKIVFKHQSDVMIKPRNMGSNITQVVRRIFEMDGQHFAELPIHVMDGLDLLDLQSNIREVNENDVTESLKRIQNTCSFTEAEKFTLLEYILESENYSLLNGLRLLPLANGSWIEFSADSTLDNIYIDNPPCHTRELLGRDVNHLFISENLKSSLKPHLLSAAMEADNQLSVFDKEYFLKEITPILKDPTSSESIQRDYYKKLWSYLSEFFLESLDSFRGLYILIMQQENFVIERLPGRDDCTLVVCSHDDLTDKEEQLMKSLGVVVYRKVELYILNHPAISEVFLLANTLGKVDTIIKQLKSLDVERFTAISNQLSPISREELRRLFLSIDLDYVTDERIDMLKSMPIFETLNGDFVSLSKCSRNGPKHDYILPIPEIIINADAPYSQTLLLSYSSPMQSLSQEEVLLCILEQSIENFSHEEIEKFIRQCLPFVKTNPLLKEKLSSTRFVSTKSRGLLKPSELLDRRDALLELLFEDEDVFPVGQFNNEEDLMILRNHLGLRSKDNLSDEEIVSVAEAIDRSPPQSLKKATALFDYISLNDNVWSKIRTKLEPYAWIPLCQLKPDSYPKHLLWKNDNCILPKMWSATRSYELALVCGSTAHIAKYQSRIDFEEATLEEVLLHLKECISCYTNTDKPNFMLIILNIYWYLHRHFPIDEVIAGLKENQIEEWIWVGDRFVSPEFCAFAKPFSNFEPYLFSIPAELHEDNEIRTFLLACGVEEQFSFCDVLKRIQSFYELESDLSEERRDFNIVVAIINHLADDPTAEYSLTDLVIPIDRDHLKLMPANRCVYVDTANNEGFSIEDLEEELYVVNSRITPQVSAKLGIPSLISVLMSDEDYDYDTGFGQSEQLTTRLKNILRDYGGGLNIIKELLQNADDAGATNVRIVYDSRHFEGNKTHLFDSTMKSLHNPALLVYNDAIFQEKDFKNIIKLGGATKEESSDKVGRFGIGFNTVYHFTDVPSFISSNNIVFFDPHKKYLGKAMRNKDQPGIKLDMSKRFFQKQRELFVDQFYPFNNIFGCDLSPASSMANYDATLFRFPLRTLFQAEDSEISSNCLSKNDIINLFKGIYENGHELLLFLQNVTKIDVYVLSDDIEDLMLQPLCSIDKAMVHSIDDFSDHPQQQCKFNILEKIKRKFGNRLQSDHHHHALDRLTFVLCVDRVRDLGYLTFFDEDESNESWQKKYFLISHCSGFWQSSIFTDSDAFKNNFPVGSVAFSVNQDDIPEAIKGKFYCFLPLQQEHNLRFHINGYFDISTSRTELKPNPWNEFIMSFPAVEALIRSLDVLKDRFQSAHEWYSYWPTVEALTSNTPLQYLARAFYDALIDRDDLKFLSSSDRSWTSYSQCVFLDPSFDPLIFHTAKRILVQIIAIVDPSKYVVVIPANVCDIFKEKSKRFLEHFYNRDRFFEEIFIPYVEKISESEYSKFMIHSLFTLRTSDKVILKLIKENPCILTSGKGRKFLKPCQLIDPSSKLKHLYGLSDHRFPKWGPDNMKKLYSEFQSLGSPYETVLSNLRELGMEHQTQPWDVLIERSRTLESKTKELGINRSRVLVELIVDKIRANDEPSPEHVTQLKSVPFLLNFGCPCQFTVGLPLFKDAREFIWCSINESYLDRHSNLVSCNASLIDSKAMESCEKNAFNKFTEYFSLDKSIPQAYVDDQIQKTVNLIESAREEQKFEISKIMKDILHHIEHLHKQQEGDFQTRLKLKELPIVYFSDSNYFVSPNKCAQDGINIAPFLYGLPATFRNHYPCIIRHLKVPAQFSEFHYIDVLNTIFEANRHSELNEQLFKVSIEIIRNLCKISRKVNQEIYLPDNKQILRLKSELCFNYTPFIVDEDMIYVHKLLSYKEAVEILGVKEDREKLLDDNTYGVSFGQSADTTCEFIKTILQEYPCDESIMKEMIHIADDVGVTALYFILDYRSHPDEKVFSDEWKELQGPALLIYQDKPFSDSDIAAIQTPDKWLTDRLHPISHGHLAERFNCIYHLTDVPTFITNSSDKGESLFAFDPRGKYVHAAKRGYYSRQFPAEKLEKSFSHVFQCYRSIQDQLSSRCGTLFRFPLRTPHANQSEPLLVQQGTSPPTDATFIREMFKRISNDLDKCLLFMKHIRAIKLCEILEHENDMKEIMWSASIIKDQHHVDSTESFIDYFEKSREKIKSLKDSLSFKVRDTVHKKTILTEKFVNNCAQGLVESEWLLVDRFGADGTAEYSKMNPHLNNRMLCIPRGGVALPLTADGKIPQSGNFFCCLPLAIDCTFPLHINAHFSLQKKSTKLNFAETEFDKLWNKFLMQKIIAPAYHSLINHFKELKSPDQSVEVFVDSYYKLFPKSTVHPRSESEALSQLLIDGFYTCLRDHQGGSHFPMVRECFISDAQLQQLSWHNYTLTNRRGRQLTSPTYFVRRNTTVAALPILKRIGMVIINCPDEIQTCMQTNGIRFDMISPEAAIKHFEYLFYSNSIAGKYPSETLFESEDKFVTFYNYAIFSNGSQNFPVLSSDGRIRILNKCSTLFTTIYSDLIHNRKDLFVHPNLQTSNAPSAYLRDLTIPDLSRFLAFIFTSIEFFNGKIVSQERISTFEVKETWLARFWQFLRENVNVRERNRMLSDLKCLSNWSLLPVLQGKKQLLLPIGRLDTVLNLSEFDDQLLRSGLIQLSIYQPNNQISNVIVDFLKRNPNISDILSALKSIRSDFRSAKLSLEEAKRLCAYFSYAPPEYSHFIKTLPMFIDISNNIMSIPQTSTAYSIEDDRVFELDSEELDFWLNRTDSIVFLRWFEEFRHLYDIIECKIIQLDFAYLQLIFPKLHTMSRTNQMKHLNFIKDLFYNKSEWNKFKLSSDILKFLKTFEFINANDINALKDPSYFYNPNVRIFRMMIPEKQLLPVEFCHDWLEFLLELDVVNNLTDKDLLKFVNKIAQNPDDDKSQELINCIFQCPHRPRQLLEEIGRIKFLKPYKIDSQFDRIIPQFEKVDNSLSYISFRKSILEDYFLLAWSQYDILPNQQVYSENSHLLIQLGVLVKPKIEKICDHLLLLCQNIIDIPHNSLWCFDNILLSIFLHLNSIRITPFCKAKLTEANIVPYFQDDQQLTFFQPVHVIMQEVDQEEEILPYLCGLNRRLFPVRQLFLQLDAQENISVDSYCLVLLRIFEKTNGEVLNESDRAIVSKSTDRFLQYLKNHPEPSVELRHRLYLPTEGGCLLPSRELIYVDNPYLKRRVTKLNYPIFQRPNFKYDLINLFSKLSESVQPKPLSGIVKENICQIELSSNMDSFYHRVCNKFDSDKFANGVIRILYSELQIREENFAKIRTALKRVKVKAISKLVTVLKECDNTINGSEHECNIHFDILPNDHTLLCLKGCLSTSEHSLVLTKLAQNVLNVVRYSNDQQCVWLIRAILECDDQHIDYILDDLSVKELPNFQSSMERISNELFPGEYIPLQWHRLINLDLNTTFTKGASVAYEVFDPESADQPVYIMTKVIQMNDTKDDPLLNTCQLDFGNGESKLVKMLYLFKYGNDRCQTIVNDDEQIFSRNQISLKDFDIDDVKDELRSLLDQAKSYSSQDCKQLIKRLALKWQLKVNSNSNDCESCSAVVHFILREAQRIHSSCFDYLKNIKRRSRFLSNLTECSQNGNSFQLNFQPTEAKRWMRQARCDLNASKNHYNENSSEWVCYQCHQAAEKALKAVRFFKGEVHLKDNNLRVLCWDDERIRCWSSQLESIGSTTSFQYPSKQFDSIPNQMYDCEIGRRAYQLASWIVDRAQIVINSA